MSSDFRKQFERDLAEVGWKDLRIHLQRDAIILVAADLDLLEVAIAVAEDRKEQVADWISGAQLSKPTAEQVAAWEGALEKPFRMLIVQPFILVQAVDHG